MTAAPISEAMALAKSVLPVPGGPQKIIPLGISSSIALICSSLVSPSLRASTSRISPRSRSFTLA